MSAILNFVSSTKSYYYPTALRKIQITPKTTTAVQISRGICTPEDRLDGRFSRNAQATNWIEVTKKMAYNLNYFSDDEQSEWLASIDPRLFAKSNVEKQSEDSEMARPFRYASHTSRIDRK